MLVFLKDDKWRQEIKMKHHRINMDTLIQYIQVFKADMDLWINE